MYPADFTRHRFQHGYKANLSSLHKRCYISLNLTIAQLLSNLFSIQVKTRAYHVGPRETAAMSPPREQHGSPKAITETALPFSPADEKRLVRKLDRTILPWIMLLYLLSYIDRSNMGNARNIGLEEDIGLSSVQYQIASASFYIGTVIFGTIGALMLKVVKPSTWLGICAVGWGAVSTLQAACVNPGGLIAVRFFLGVFEASFAPGCALYLSFWYLKSELSLRIAAYAGMSALSGVISGVVAYSMGLAKNMAVTSWQGLFLVEGLPTIAVGAATFWMLPGRPESGKSFWFTDEEHQIILNRRSRFTRNADEGISKAQVKA